MSPLTLETTEITINDQPTMAGHFEIEQEWITLRFEVATKPNPSWTLVDANGHFHAYADKGELPTLVARSRHIDCDGGCGENPDSCEGYDVTEWFCLICDEQVEPGRLPDRESTIPGRKHWWATVNPEREITGQVSVRIKQGDRLHFGVAVARTESMEFGHYGTRITTRLDGISALGERRG